MIGEVLRQLSEEKCTYSLNPPPPHALPSCMAHHGVCCSAFAVPTTVEGDLQALPSHQPLPPPTIINHPCCHPVTPATLPSAGGCDLIICWWLRPCHSLIAVKFPQPGTYPTPPSSYAFASLPLPSRIALPSRSYCQGIERTASRCGVQAAGGQAQADDRHAGGAGHDNVHDHACAASRGRYRVARYGRCPTALLLR